MRTKILTDTLQSEKHLSEDHLIFGVIKDSQTQEVLPNLTIEIAYATKNGLSWGTLESDTTDINGNFSILFSKTTIENLDRLMARQDERPDVILRVKSITGLLIHQTIFSGITQNSCGDNYRSCNDYEIYIDHASELMNALFNDMIPDDLNTQQRLSGML